MQLRWFEAHREARHVNLIDFWGRAATSAQKEYHTAAQRAVLVKFDSRH
jgi:hypothetical protein